MNALVLFRHNGVVCSITEEAIALRDAALARSALVGAVRNEQENEAASAAQKDIKNLLVRIEEGRKAVKEPCLELCRSIDSEARAAVEELKAEDLRLSQAMADWQSEQLERVREQERQRQAEIERIEAQRREEMALLEAERKRLEEEAAERAAAELAKARSAAQRKAVEARAKAEAELIAREVEQAAQHLAELRQQEIAALPAVAPPAKAEGQTVRGRWTFEVTDIWLLARTNPGLVRIEPCRSEINEVIERLAEASTEPKIAGLRIWRETKVGVRLGREKVLDV